MKRILLLITTLLLVSALVFSVSAAESSANLTPSSTEIVRGDTFTVSIILTNEQEIRLGQVVVNYDVDAFELIGGSCSVEDTLTAAVIPAQKVGTFILSEPSVIFGKIFTFEFKVKDDAAFGRYEINATASIGLETGKKIETNGTAVEVKCMHTFGDWSNKNEFEHESTCSICKQTVAENHNWDIGHTEYEPGCTTPGEILYTCLTCGATKKETIKPTGHRWDNDCNTVCNNGCGATRETEHKWSAQWTGDEAGHYYKCTSCGEKGEYSDHIPGAPATETNAQTCTVCGYELESALGHEHIMGTQWMTDAQYHWHRCEKRNPTCLHTEDKAPHDYDNNCDVDCNTCGYVRIPLHTYKPEWQGDEEGHWKLCALCGAASDIKPHVPGAEATETTPQVCEECNYWVKWPLNHVHTYGETWMNDELNHWHSCVECGHVDGMEIHKWDAGVLAKEPTETEEGLRQWTCTVCEKQVSETVPALGSSAQPSNPTGNGEQPSEPESEEGGFPWQIVGIAAIVLLGIGVVLLVMEIIRSSRINSRGRFSR